MPWRCRSPDEGKRGGYGEEMGRQAMYVQGRAKGAGRSQWCKGMGSASMWSVQPSGGKKCDGYWDDHGGEGSWPTAAVEEALRYPEDVLWKIILTKPTPFPWHCRPEFFFNQSIASWDCRSCSGHLRAMISAVASLPIKPLGRVKSHRSGGLNGPNGISLARCASAELRSPPPACHTAPPLGGHLAGGSDGSAPLVAPYLSTPFRPPAALTAPTPTVIIPHNPSSFHPLRFPFPFTLTSCRWTSHTPSSWTLRLWPRPRCCWRRPGGRRRPPLPRAWPWPRSAAPLLRRRPPLRRSPPLPPQSWPRRALARASALTMPCCTCRSWASPPCSCSSSCSSAALRYVVAFRSIRMCWFLCSELRYWLPWVVSLFPNPSTCHCLSLKHERVDVIDQDLTTLPLLCHKLTRRFRPFFSPGQRGLLWDHRRPAELSDALGAHRHVYPLIASSGEPWSVPPFFFSFLAARIEQTPLFCGIPILSPYAAGLSSPSRPVATAVPLGSRPLWAQTCRVVHISLNLAVRRFPVTSRRVLQCRHWP